MFGWKKDRVGCYWYIYGYGYYYNIYIKLINFFFKKNVYDFVFILNIIFLYFLENSEIMDWNMMLKGGRGSEYCYLFIV